MPEQEEVQGLMLQLALLEKECPGYEHKLLEHPPCDTCHNTGKVPLLDPELVREKCLSVHNLFITEADETTGIVSCSCEEADCRGWGPTDDMWKWFEVALRLGFAINFRIFSTEPLRISCQLVPYGEEVEDTTRLAFFRALAKTLGVRHD